MTLDRHGAAAVLAVVLWVETEDFLVGRPKSSLWTRQQSWPTEAACEAAKTDAVRTKSLGWTGPEVAEVTTRADTYVSVRFKSGGTLNLTYRCLPEDEDPRTAAANGNPVAPPTDPAP